MHPVVAKWMFLAMVLIEVKLFPGRMCLIEVVDIWMLGAVGNPDGF